MIHNITVYAHTCMSVCVCVCVRVGVSLFQDYVSWRLRVVTPGQCLLFIETTSTGKSQLDTFVVVWNCAPDFICVFTFLGPAI